MERNNYNDLLKMMNYFIYQILNFYLFLIFRYYYIGIHFLSPVSYFGNYFTYFDDLSYFLLTFKIKNNDCELLEFLQVVFMKTLAKN